MEKIVDGIKRHFLAQDMTTRLIYINVVLFLVVRLMDFLSLACILPTGWVLQWLQIPSGNILTSLMSRPWTVGTYMFTHYDFLHIVFNMLALYWFGRLCSALVAEHVVLYVYLIGGVAGALAFWFAPASIVRPYSSMLGASAAVMALILCSAFYNPNYIVGVPLVGSIKLKWYAAIFVVIDIISIPGFVNVGGHIAHLGGAIAGALLAVYWKSHGIPVRHAFARRGEKTKMKIERGGRAMTDEEWNRQKKSRSAEVDRILEKIKSSGYDSLSKEERQMLFDESKRL
ncbi:MAG: rhomboid family intramembrane serine protease [Marinilabiliaceae bacterium]|nr:rhomboid family intramembrane serine protease [Marinilabiliaceae bacterium]